MLALAGPGSGKTTVIVERIRHLIDVCQVPPVAILVVTFSKEAAREMRERFLKATKRSSTLVTFGTFHSVFYGILRQAYGLTAANILGEEKKRQILRGLAEQAAPRLLEEREYLEEFSREIAQVKGMRLAIDHYYATSCPDEIFRRLYREYIQLCRARRLVDFEDMLVMCWELLTKREDILAAWQNRFQYLLIDEFQDINQLQYDIVKLLAFPKKNLFVVGDDDQSIYYFRGARPEIMLRFGKEFPQAKQVLLDVNYRCTQEILDGALRLIAHNKRRYKKKLRTPGVHGEEICVRRFLDPREEYKSFVQELLKKKEDGSDLSQTAALFRTHVEAEGLIRLLMEYNLPFTMKDRLPNMYEHWLARDLRTYLKIAHGSRDRKDFLAIMNRPNRYISREAVYEKQVSFEALRIFYEEKDWMCDRIDALEHHLKVLASLPPFAAVVFLRKTMGYDDYVRDYALCRRLKPEELLELLDRLQESAKEAASYQEWEEQIARYTEELQKQQSQNRQRGGGVVLATLHSVKGLEYEDVFIFNVNEGTIPYKKAVLEEQIEEERRLLYVGMTRAKRRLSLYYTASQHEKQREESRFLKEIEEHRTGILACKAKIRLSQKGEADESGR